MNHLKNTTMENEKELERRFQEGEMSLEEQFERGYINETEYDTHVKYRELMEKENLN